MDPALFQENERTAPAADERQYIEVGDLRTQNGDTIPNITVAYETWGELNEDKSNAILACHALSGDSHAIGWWSRLIGPGKAIDTDRYFVIGSNCLGGCQGTTGPTSDAPNGQKYATNFPRITVEDMVEVQIRLLSHLGIQQLLCAAGGSMGGMQALEWTRRGKVRKGWVTAACAAHNAMQIAFNETARQAIIRDPKWQKGHYSDTDPPTAGLAVARMLGHISFLSEEAFNTKFNRTRAPLNSPEMSKNGLFELPEFEVESYLNYQGDKFTKRFDPNSLLYLTKAIDHYNCESLKGSTSEYLFTSFKSDWLYPSHQSKELHRMAQSASCKSTWIDIDLPQGHDAFLLDATHQAQALKAFLEDSI